MLKIEHLRGALGRRGWWLPVALLWHMPASGILGGTCA
jgi:hypothetical protein